MSSNATLSPPEIRRGNRNSRSIDMRPTNKIKTVRYADGSTITTTTTTIRPRLDSLVGTPPVHANDSKGNDEISTPRTHSPSAPTTAKTQTANRQGENSQSDNTHNICASPPLQSTTPNAQKSLPLRPEILSECNAPVPPVLSVIDEDCKKMMPSGASNSSRQKGKLLKHKEYAHMPHETSLVGSKNYDQMRSGATETGVRQGGIASISSTAPSNPTTNIARHISREEKPRAHPPSFHYPHPEHPDQRVGVTEQCPQVQPSAPIYDAVLVVDHPTPTDPSNSGDIVTIPVNPENERHLPWWKRHLRLISICAAILIVALAGSIGAVVAIQKNETTSTIPPVPPSSSADNFIQKTEPTSSTSSTTVQETPSDKLSDQSPTIATTTSSTAPISTTTSSTSSSSATLTPISLPIATPKPGPTGPDCTEETAAELRSILMNKDYYGSDADVTCECLAPMDATGWVLYANTSNAKNLLLCTIPKYDNDEVCAYLACHQGWNCINPLDVSVKMCYIQVGEEVWETLPEGFSRTTIRDIRYFTKGVANVAVRTVEIDKTSDPFSCSAFYVDGIQCESCDLCEDTSVAANCDNLVKGAVSTCNEGDSLQVLLELDSDA